MRERRKGRETEIEEGVVDQGIEIEGAPEVVTGSDQAAVIEEDGEVVVGTAEEDREAEAGTGIGKAHLNLYLTLSV